MMVGYPDKNDLVFAYERGCTRAAYESMIDRTPPNLALKRIFAEGNVVDEIAQRSIFSDGVTIDTLDVHQASAETSVLMADRSVSRINQATFVDPGRGVTRLDSIVRSDGKWTHIEVKSGTDVKSKYVYDSLVSTDRALRAGLDVDRVILVTLDGDWRLGDPQEDLFRYTDITEKVQNTEMVEFLSRTYDDLEGGGAPSASLVKGCWKCQYFSSCFGDVEYPVTLLNRVDDAKASALAKRGIIDLREIPEGFDLSISQRATVDAAFDTEEHIDKPLLREMLSELQPPIRHLDFEWSSFAVPLHTGVAPWGAVTTQYSIHLEINDGIAHSEYLCESEGDDRRALAESMIEDLGDDGSIVVYSMAAERSRIREMASWFPDLSDELLAIESRLFDLHPLVKKCLSYPKFFGRSSLKIIQSIVPGLDYDDLEIDNGQEAMGAMGLMMRGMVDPSDIAHLRERLLRYCERDTEATVRVLRLLREMAVD